MNESVKAPRRVITRPRAAIYGSPIVLLGLFSAYLIGEVAPWMAAGLVGLSAVAYASLVVCLPLIQRWTSRGVIARRVVLGFGFCLGCVAIAKSGPVVAVVGAVVYTMSFVIALFFDITGGAPFSGRLRGRAKLAQEAEGGHATASG